MALVSAVGCSSEADDPSKRQESDAGGAPEATGPRVYASVSGTDEVVAIDAESHVIVDRYAVGGGPAIVLTTPANAKLYTANWADDSVSAIDTASGEVTSIPLPGRPYVIATPPAGDFVYAGLSPTGIAVIDTVSDEIVRMFSTPELAASLIVSPDGRTLYVATFDILALGAGDLRAIDTQTGEELHERIPVGDAPAWITIHPDGSRVYTLNFLSDDISVVDTQSWEVVDTVSTGPGSQAIIANVTPDGRTLYVTNHGTAELMGIDTETHEIVQTVSLSGRPVGVEFNQDASRVYVTDFGPASLDEPLDITYLLSGSLTTTGDGHVSAYDRETGALVGEKVVVGPGPTSVVARTP